MAEKTLNNLQWKRTSELVKVGFLNEADNLATVKRKCAEMFGLDTNPHNPVVVHSGARLDETAFATLGQFLTSLTPQQKSKLSLGIAAKTNKANSRAHGKGIDLIVHRCITKRLVLCRIVKVRRVHASGSEPTLQESSTRSSHSTSRCDSGVQSISRLRSRSPLSRNGTESPHSRQRADTVDKQSARGLGRCIHAIPAFSVCMEGGEVKQVRLLPQVVISMPCAATKQLKFNIYCTNIIYAGILPNYTEPELFAATDGWASTNLLSEGGFGKVFIGKLRATTVAVKVFKQVNALLVHLVSNTMTQYSLNNRM